MSHDHMRQASTPLWWSLRTTRKHYNTRTYQERTKQIHIYQNNNIFESDTKTFREVRGTAIGTKFAPQYAILFMVYLEEKILSAFEEKL